MELYNDPNIKCIDTQINLQQNPIFLSKTIEQDLNFLGNKEKRLKNLNEIQAIIMEIEKEIPVCMSKNIYLQINGTFNQEDWKKNEDKYLKMAQDKINKQDRTTEKFMQAANNLNNVKNIGINELLNLLNELKFKKKWY